MSSGGDAEKGTPSLPVDPAAQAQAVAHDQEGLTTGAATGAALGAVVGAIGGPPGAMAGAITGALAGAVAGAVVGHERGPTGDVPDMGKLKDAVTSDAGADPDWASRKSASHDQVVMAGVDRTDMNQDLPK